MLREKSSKSIDRSIAISGFESRREIEKVWAKMRQVKRAEGSVTRNWSKNVAQMFP